MDNEITLWVAVGSNGLLTAYSLVERENMEQVVSNEEPIDYLNWGVQDGRLVHYPENIPYIPEKTDIEVVKQQNAQTSLTIVQIKQQLAKMALALVKGGANHE